MEEHDVVIVGAGIAGLATAIALKRVGVKALVLEKSEGLRATGAAIGLHPNAWLALEALGVAHKLTTTTYPLWESTVLSHHFHFMSFLFPFLITIMHFYATLNFFMKFLDFLWRHFAHFYLHTLSLMQVFTSVRFNISFYIKIKIYFYYFRPLFLQNTYRLSINYYLLTV